MKKLILLTLALTLANVHTGHAQLGNLLKQVIEVAKDEALKKANEVSHKTSNRTSKRIISNNNQKAYYPGGTRALDAYVRGHLRINHLKKLKNRYPTARVVMEFTVNADGRISDLNKISSPHSGLTDEAARVLRKMPNWIPARSNGRAVKSRARYTVNFYLKDIKIGSFARAASYPGGKRALDAYFRSNLRTRHLMKLVNRFPTANVVMEFDVDSDGTIKHLKKISSPHSGFTDEAVRVMRKMRNWNPAYKNGSPIRTRQRYTVRFNLAQSDGFVR